MHKIYFNVSSYLENIYTSDYSLKIQVIKTILKKE